MDVAIDIMCLSRLFSTRSSGRCRHAKEEDACELDKDFTEHCNVGWEKTCGVSSELKIIRGSSLKEIEDRLKGILNVWHGMMVVFIYY